MRMAVMVGVGMVVWHGKTLHYNISGVHAWDTAREAWRTPSPPCHGLAKRGIQHALA